MTEPILTGAEVREHRTTLNLTQEQLATKLGFNGDYRRQRISNIEAGSEEIDYARGNLLLAMVGGYVPTSTIDPITLRQAEALETARTEGDAKNLKTTTKRGRGGGFSRMLKALQEKGWLGSDGTITEDGLEVLDDYRVRHGKKPLNPRTKHNPTGRWV